VIEILLLPDVVVLVVVVVVVVGDEYELPYRVAEHVRPVIETVPEFVIAKVVHVATHEPMTVMPFATVY
jgi:hypothetical protein